MSRHRAARLSAAGMCLALALAGCGRGAEPAAPGGGPTLGRTTLNGSGATFPKNFYEAAIDGFEARQPRVTVNYQGGGSGKGRTDLQEGLADFAGSDAPVKDSDRPKFQGDFVSIPTVAAPITISFNLPRVDSLVLDAEAIARIFQRDVTAWDDPAIRDLNPGVPLPSTSIIVAHRSDGSGTTENFTRYLDKAAPSWRLGSGSTVEWPADTQAGNGNAGVAQIVKTQTGAIGYVDLADARTQRLTVARLRNRSGAVVEPTLEATTVALEGVELRADLTYDPLDSAAPGAYPIASPTWMLAYTTQTDRKRGEALKAWLTYLVTDGQALARENEYAPLPASFTARARAAIATIEVGA